VTEKQCVTKIILLQSKNGGEKLLVFVFIKLSCHVCAAEKGNHLGIRYNFQACARHIAAATMLFVIRQTTNTQSQIPALTVLFNINTTRCKMANLGKWSLSKQVDFTEGIFAY